MPNAKTHLIVGAVTGAAVNIGLQLKRIEESETGGFDCDCAAACYVYWFSVNVTFGAAS